MDNETTNYNTTGNETAYNPDFWKFFLPLQLLIFLTALFGNIMVCVVAYRLRQSSIVGRGSDSNMYLLMICLATADLGITIFFMPISIFITLFPYYEVDVSVCLLSILPMKYFTGVQLFVLMSLSLDRYYIICTSRKKKLNLPATLFSTYTISLIVPGLSLARWYEAKMIPELTVCVIDWKVEDLLFQLLEASLSCAVLVIVFCVVIFSYVSVILTIKKSMQAGIKNGVGYKLNILRRQRRVTIMLLTCVLLFGVCWMPFAGLLAILALPNVKLKDLHQGISASIVWLLCLNSACNPFVYAFGSPQYRKELCSLLRILKCKCSLSITCSIEITPKNDI